MRTLVCFGVAAGLWTASAWAGQMYGSVSEGGRGVGAARIEIDCAGNVTPGETASDGSYRVNVPQEGRCTFTVILQQRRASIVVFSYPNPAKYDFELVRRPDGNLELRRR